MPVVVLAMTGAVITGCTTKQESATSSPAQGHSSAEVTVGATDTACELSATGGTTGANTFQITNNGNKVTEFYVYGAGERVMGEVKELDAGVKAPDWTIDSTRIAVASVRPILDERNPDLGKRVDERFAAVEKLLDKYRDGDGFVSYEAVTIPARQDLSRAVDALSNEVSQVQGAVAAAR